MGRERLDLASICTHSADAPLQRFCYAAMKAAGRRTFIIAAVVVLFGSSQANAHPIGYQFATTLDYGTLAGTQIWGSMFWNDPGPGYSTAPIQSLTLNVGNRRYGLSDGVFPAYIQSPHLDPMFGFANDWGPRFQLRSNVLFGGLTNFSLFEGGNVFVVYSYSPAVPFQYFTQASGTLAVPGPSSLVVAVGALLAACYAVGRTTFQKMRA